MAKETKEAQKKSNEVIFLHRENKYFLFSEGKVRCQFINGEYKTSNPKEIELLTSYMYNRGDLLKREV